MKSLAVLSIAFWLSASLAGAQPPREPGATVDALGDPLPNCAVLRLGSLRFRHPGAVYELALSPDERTIVSMGDKIIAWDTATGKQLWSDDLRKYGLNINGVAYGMRLVDFSPEGRRLYTPMGPNAVLARYAATGKAGEGDMLRIEAALPLRAGNRVAESDTHAIEISPDGKKLALGRQLRDVAHEQRTAHLECRGLDASQGHPLRSGLFAGRCPILA